MELFVVVGAELVPLPAAEGGVAVEEERAGERALPDRVGVPDVLVDAVD